MLSMLAAHAKVNPFEWETSSMELAELRPSPIAKWLTEAFDLVLALSTKGAL